MWWLNAMYFLTHGIPDQARGRIGTKSLCTLQGDCRYKRSSQIYSIVVLTRGQAELAATDRYIPGNSPDVSDVGVFWKHVALDIYGIVKNQGINPHYIPSPRATVFISPDPSCHEEVFCETWPRGSENHHLHGHHYFFDKLGATRHIHASPRRYGFA